MSAWALPACDMCGTPLSEEPPQTMCARCRDDLDDGGRGSCLEDPDYVCDGTCSECEVNQ